MQFNSVNKKTKFLLAAAVVLPFSLCSLPPLYAAMKIIPVADISLLGGKYFLDSKSASFQARADAFVSPVVKMSDSHELIPVLSGYYNGTQDVQELANFFERRVSAYQTGVTGAVAFTDEF